MKFKIWSIATCLVGLTYSNECPSNHCDRFKQDVYHLQEENVGLTTRNSWLETRLNQTLDDNAVMQDKMSTMELKIEKLEMEIKSTRNELSLEISELKSLFFQEMKKDSEATHAQTLRLEQKLEKEIENIEEDLEEIEEDLEKVEDEVEKIEDLTDIKIVESLIDTKLSVVDDKFHSELDELTNSLEEDIQNVESSIIQLNSTMVSLDQKLENSKPIAKKPLCLGKGLHKIVKNRLLFSNFVLYSSYRLSFVLTLNAFPKETRSIFRITDMLNDSIYNRHPMLRISPEKRFYLGHNKCDGDNDNFHLHTFQIYDVQNLELKQPHAITIEYIRHLNLVKFYLDSVEMTSIDTERIHMNPTAVCYGIQGSLFVGDNHYPAADGTVQNFSYEENVSDQALGSLSVQEILNNVCQ